MAEQVVNPMVQNAIGRQRLLSSGVSMVKRLQPVSAGLGSTIRIPLQRMGIMTGVMLQFSLQVDISRSSGSPVPSVLAPFNLAKTVTYTDFAGVNRTKTNGFQLWCAQAFKQGDAYGYIPGMSGGPGSAPSLNYDTNILNLPSGTGNNQMIYFSLYVPMAYDPASDLTGAVMTQTNVGEHFITVDLPNALAGADPYTYLYDADTTVTLDGNIVCEAFQYYIQPQDMRAESLPMIDLSTVYGFEGGFQTTANIGAGQSTYISLPNNRVILSTLFQFENGNTFTANGADLSGITLLANSNTHFRELTPRMLRESMRNMVNSDMPPGTYVLSSRRQPIMTQLYANVQIKADVVSVASSGNVQMVSQFEVQYPSGSPLPGITMAG